MPLPPVIVEISVPDASAELRARLVDACTRAVQGTECRESQGTGLDPNTVAAVAIVSWQGEGAIRIEIGREPNQHWHTRILRFGKHEDRTQVFTAVGFAIGTLVGKLQEEDELPPSPPVPTQDSPPPPEPPPKPPDKNPARAARPRSANDVRGESEPRQRPRRDRSEPPMDSGASVSWLATVGGEVGTGRALGSYRLGGFTGFALIHRSGANVGVSGSYAGSLPFDAALRERWLTLVAGPGYDIVAGEHLSVMLAGEFGAEYFHSTATDPSTGFNDGRSRWISIARAGVGLVVPRRASVAAFLGAHVTVPFGTTDVTIAGEPQRSPAPLRLTAVLGLRHDGRSR